MAAWADAAMAAVAAAVSLCGRIASPPFLAFVGAIGPDKGWPSGPKPSGAFRHACESTPLQNLGTCSLPG